MKGSPPFSRKSITAEALDGSLGGLARALRRGARKPLVAMGKTRVLNLESSLWLIAMVDKDLVVGIRLIAERFELANVAGRRLGEKGLVVTASGGLGKYRATVEVEEAAIPRLRVRVTLRTASKAVLMESMPREVCMMHRNFEPLDEGYVYTKQTGPTAGQACCGWRHDPVLFPKPNRAGILWTVGGSGSGRECGSQLAPDRL